MVNNAGIASPLDWIENLTTGRTTARWSRSTICGTVYVTKAAWPHLVAGGNGRIVNTTSEGLLGMVPKNSSYGSAKGAVLGFTRAVAIDASRHGIQVNAVVPRAQTRMSTADILAHVYDAPPDAFGASMPQYARRVRDAGGGVPGARVLSAQRRAPHAGGGQVMRLALMETTGYTSEVLSPELVAEHIDQILDMEAAQLMTVGVLRSEISET